MQEKTDHTGVEMEGVAQQTLSHRINPTKD
jgi:hypothetical protein